MGVFFGSCARGVGIGCVVTGVEIVWLEDDEDGSCEG